MRNQARSSVVAMALSLMALLSLVRPVVAEEKVTAIDPPEFGFFSKQIMVAGVPIKAGAVVSDEAMREAHRRIGRLLEHLPEAAGNLVDAGCELQIIGKDQAVSDLPELRHYKGQPYSRDANGKSETIDERTRGVGGRSASCGEENLLKLPVDRYRDHRDICSHEFSHTLLRYGMSENVRKKVREQYQSSIANGLWKTAYASTNFDEFFAELTMWYFDSRGDFGQITPKPQPGREWLKAYDPEAFATIDDIYSGRVPVKRVEWETLTSRPSDEATQLRSGASDHAAKLVIENHTEAELMVFWIDAAGARKPYGKIIPTGRFERDTFVGHPWLVMKADGTVSGLFVPVGERNRAVIR